MGSHFDEKAGVVELKTPFGSWSQTMEDVNVVVNLPAGTRGKDLICDIQNTHLRVQLRGAAEPLLEGKLRETVIADDSVWTIEDGQELHITLVKSDRTAANTWPSLMVTGNRFAADAIAFEAMEKKATLERFQRENPGFDFSGAEISGNFHKGGPALPS